MDQMAKVKKQPRPKAETPKGFVDYFGADVRERGAMLEAIGKVYHRYGFDPLETSAIETVEALGTPTFEFRASRVGGAWDMRKRQHKTGYDELNRKALARFADDNEFLRGRRVGDEEAAAHGDSQLQQLCNSRVHAALRAQL